MSFANLVFNHTHGLSQYSDLITTALNTLGTNHGYNIQRCGTIASSKRDEDELDYWGPGSSDITFGRHLEFSSAKVSVPIHFWVGMDLLIRYSRFILWFQYSALSPTQLNTLQHLHGTHFTGAQIFTEPPDTEICFSLLDTEFDAFCTPPYPTNDIENFLYEILSVL